MSTWQPTVMHMTNGDGEVYCRERSRVWPERFMDDRVARTLPRCPACLEELSRRKTLRVSHREQAHINTEKQKQDRLLSDLNKRIAEKKQAESISPLYLVDYINKLNMSG